MHVFVIYKLSADETEKEVQAAPVACYTDKQFAVAKLNNEVAALIQQYADVFESYREHQEENHEGFYAELSDFRHVNVEKEPMLFVMSYGTANNVKTYGFRLDMIPVSESV